MIPLPKHILKGITNNKTSLGLHPSFPPDEEDSFIVNVVSKFYGYLNEIVPNDDENELSSKINELIVRIKDIETNNLHSLEQLVVECVNDLFNIPSDTLIINCEIVNNVDNSKQRLIPEKTEDYSFDSIDDMNQLTDEIYKRRMLMSLISGASLYYSNDISSYVGKLFSVNEELPYLYKWVLQYNNKMFYLTNKELSEKNTIEAGMVDVFLSDKSQPVEINSQGIIFPILLEETIKGILELSISHGLPKNKEKAEYIIKKSDFRLAELWDIRLGLPLWIRLLQFVEENGYDLKEVGINFFFMFLSQMETNEFNSFLQECFMKTKLGSNMIHRMFEEIIKNKDEDDFNDYIEFNNQETSIEDGYFDEEELLSDSII